MNKYDRVMLWGQYIFKRRMDDSSLYIFKNNSSWLEYQCSPTIWDDIFQPCQSQQQLALLYLRRIIAKTCETIS